MSRIVLDTNIIVSALLQPVGPPEQIFVLALGGPLQLCVSANITRNMKRSSAARGSNDLTKS